MNGFPLTKQSDLGFNENISLNDGGLTAETPLGEYNNPINQNSISRSLIINIGTSFASPFQEITDLTSAIDIIVKNTSNEEILGKIGERIYNSKEQSLERKHFGKFIVIDTETEEIIAIETTPIKAMIKAKKIQDKSYFLRQIGTNTIIN